MHRRDGQWDSMAAIFNESKSAFHAIKMGGKGDVTQTHVAWSQTQGLPYVPSPLFYDGAVYLVKNGKAILQNITTSNRFQNKVQVSGGLAEGDVIITNGFINIYNGANVSVKNLEDEK
jgi:hypothetical protein